MNVYRISKFGAKKQNCEEDSVVELTSCIIEVMREVKSLIMLFDLYLHQHYLHEIPYLHQHYPYEIGERRAADHPVQQRRLP